MISFYLPFWKLLATALIFSIKWSGYKLPDHLQIFEEGKMEIVYCVLLLAGVKIIPVAILFGVLYFIHIRSQRERRLSQ